MLTDLRNAFDGQQMTFNQKYAKTKTSTFGRTMVTTNMTQDDVEVAVGNIRKKEYRPDRSLAVSNMDIP